MAMEEYIKRKGSLKKRNKMRGEKWRKNKFLGRQMDTNNKKYEN